MTGPTLEKSHFAELETRGLKLIIGLLQCSSFGFDGAHDVVVLNYVDHPGAEARSCRVLFLHKLHLEVGHIEEGPHFLDVNPWHRTFL